MRKKKTVRSLFTKYEIKFLRSANDMEFCTRVYLEIKIKKDAVSFRRTFGSMSFEKTKFHEKSVEDLERDDLVEPTHSALSLYLPKKDGTYRLVVDCCGLNKQTKKKRWLSSRTNEVIDSLEGNMYSSKEGCLSRYFQMMLEEESKN